MLGSPSISNGSNTFFISNNGQKCLLVLDGCESKDENDDKLEYLFTSGDGDAANLLINSQNCTATVDGIDTAGDYSFEV